MQAVNVEGTRTVLDAAVRGPRRRIVHTSSCATCGPVPGRCATERDLPPDTELRVPYKRTKLDGERLALEAAREGVDVVVVNPTVPVGPGDLPPHPDRQDGRRRRDRPRSRLSRAQRAQRRGGRGRRGRALARVRARARRRALPARRRGHDDPWRVRGDRLRGGTVAATTWQCRGRSLIRPPGWPTRRCARSAASRSCWCSTRCAPAGCRTCSTTQGASGARLQLASGHRRARERRPQRAHGRRGREPLSDPKTRRRRGASAPRRATGAS